MKPCANVTSQLPTRQTHTVLESEVRRNRSFDFDMELKQPVSLQDMLEGENKTCLFSALADWLRDDILNKMPAMHKHTDETKKGTAAQHEL